MGEYRKRIVKDAEMLARSFGQTIREEENKEEEAADDSP